MVSKLADKLGFPHCESISELNDCVRHTMELIKEINAIDHAKLVAIREILVLVNNLPKESDELSMAVELVKAMAATSREELVEWRKLLKQTKDIPPELKAALTMLKG